MIALLRRLLRCALLTLVAAPAALAGSVTGVVRNGTTGKTAAGVDVILLQLQGGMQAVANTKSDAQGNFHFESPEIGQQPMLLRAVYRGVNYHEPVPPGQSTADIEVFDPTQDASAFRVAHRIVFFQPNGSALLVGEQYAIENASHPPKAYYKAEGSFEFLLPEGADLSQVSAWGPSGMPVVQGTIDKGKNRYAIAFPFRPGENGVRLSYQVPYPSNAASVLLNSLYAADRTLLVAPPTMQVIGEGFSPAGTEQGMNVYSHDAVPAGAKLAVAVSGTAPPPSSDQGQESSRGGPEAAAGNITVLPGRLDNLKWILIAGFASLFVLGVFFLVRKPRVPAPAAQPAVSATAAVDREVRQSVEQIKETLFRLELRRQAGTLSEKEYAAERARAEKALREFVKG